MGTESIVNTIKDKVFQVVQDEQKLNTERQEVMTEIENKVQGSLLVSVFNYDADVNSPINFLGVL